MTGAIVDPVDPADIRRAAEGAREFEHQLAGVTFRLRAPTKFERARLVTVAQGDEVRAMRNVVEASIIGWADITVAHAMPEHKRGAEPLAYSRDALGLLLDEQVGWLGDLFAAVMARYVERQAKAEADRGNSQPASTMIAPAPAESSSASDSGS